MGFILDFFGLGDADEDEDPAPATETTKGTTTEDFTDPDLKTEEPEEVVEAPKTTVDPNRDEEIAASRKSRRQLQGRRGRASLKTSSGSQTRGGLSILSGGS